MATLKEWMDSQWQNPGVINGACGNIFLDNGKGKPVIKAGAERKIQLDKETKRRQANLATYHPKLAAVILAEASIEMRPGEVRLYDERKRYISSKKGELPHYTWPKQSPVAIEAKHEPISIEPKQTTKKRVTKTKVTQAAAILEKVPADSLPAFLQRFDLPAAIAASIIAAGNTNEMAKLFLQSTINA